MSQDQRAAFEALLGEYWSIAYSEGRVGVSRGDDANHVLSKIRAALSQPRAKVSDAIVEALQIGLECAQEVAINYHAAMLGFRPEQHEAVDADVRKIEAALLAAQAAPVVEHKWPEPLTCTQEELQAAIDCITSQSQAAPVQEDAKDAARYRWLRDRLSAADFSYGDPPRPVLIFDWPSNVGIGGNCDMNIDAAIAKEQP